MKLLYHPRTEFIKAVGQSGLNFEDLACIGGINVLTLFKFAAGEIKLYENQLKTMAAILGKGQGELFGPEDIKD